MRINFWESAVAVAIIGFAGAMAYIGASYPVGTLGDMGPGYFPLMVSLATAAMGVITLVEVATSPSATLHVSWRAILFTVASILSWALLAERFGLIPASLALILLASLARPPVKIVSSVVTAVLVSACAVGLFIYGFDLPLRPLRW
jgi:putative tricarboxylic transport membrane protein